MKNSTEQNPEKKKKNKKKKKKYKAMVVAYPEN